MSEWEGCREVGFQRTKISGLMEDVQVELGFCLVDIYLLDVAEGWVQC